MYGTYAGLIDAFVAKIIPTEGFLVTGILPGRGGDTGTVSAIVWGGGFIDGATVSLVGPGGQIVGENTTVMNINSIATIFDLTGKARGLYDVVVTNPYGESVTVTQGFTIEEGKALQMWVDILGRDTVRPGQPQTYTIWYGNRGNTDALGTWLWIAIPKDATWELGSEITPPFGLEELGVDWSEVPIYAETEQEIIIPLIIPKMPPDSAAPLKLNIAVPGSLPFQLRAGVNPPMFQSPITLPMVKCLTAVADLVFDFIPAVDCFTEILTGSAELIGALSSADGLKPYSAVHIFGGMALQCVGEVTGIGMAAEFAIDIIRQIHSETALRDNCIEALLEIMGVEIAVQQVTSVDPNEKVGARGFGEVRYISGEEPFRYAIYYENLETATAPAQEVRITDQLDVVHLDLSTFGLGPISFGDKDIFIPIPGTKEFTTDVDLRPDNDLIVRIEASLDLDTGVVTWYFKSIDPATGELPEDPFSGFLPPNVNPPDGQGCVMFTVMPKEGIASETMIDNQATIVFDTNPPIDTNIWTNTIDNIKPQSQVLPLAAKVPASFMVGWSGEDIGSSGIKDYSIYVSEDGGPYTAWLSYTTSTSGLFTGEVGKTYRFYSIARDNVGNLEDTPDVPDATTTSVVIVFGPKQYFRTKGPADVYTDAFSATPGEAALTVENGDADGNSRVSSALVSVNGVEVFGTQDFSEGVYILEAPVSLSENNSITVEVKKAKEGSYLTVTITTITSGGPNQAPVAVANGPYSGTVDVPVAFSSAGSYDPDGDTITYLWAFGDGDTSTEENPTHTYTSADTYTVSLTVTDPYDASDVDTTTATITGGGPNQAPVAVANGPYSGTVDVPVAFSSSGSYDPDGDTITYLWAFGDGDTSTEENPTHTYTAADTYTVSLTVTDPYDASDTDTTTATITGGGPNDPPVANAGPDVNAMVREDITFDGTGSYDPDGDTITYLWAFGDNKTGSGPIVVHDYKKPGTYDVTLTVTDDLGAQGQDTAIAIITK